VLVVDDTVENLQLLSRMLEEHGYEARPVTSGSQALQAALSYPPELVLLDISMPEMDGFEVCRRLKANETLREVPVIFLTALANIEDKVRAFEAGGADFITKPFQVDEVLARVRVHVGLRQSRAELLESYRRLQSLERLREDLVRMVVHDMRSPLTVLTSLLSFVQEELRGSSCAHLSEELALAVHATASVNRMANAMLDVSRLEEGKFPLERRAHDVVALCRDVIRQFATVDRSRSIELTGMPELEVVCDGEVVGRVVENLLSNAIKYTPLGSAIRISVQLMGEQARISMLDQGPGVSAEERKQIFEKFVTGEAQAVTKLHSIGLGLAFCKLAVEAHGGAIAVESGHPRGSVFWFSLPI
jgi:signal transduction histidine kinase